MDSDREQAIFATREILTSASTLDPKKQLAFALLIFERMLPSLRAFSKETGFDDSCYLLAREAAWTALLNGAADQAVSRKCFESAPDTEDYSHGLTSQALNTALALSEILKFTLDLNKAHIQSILELANDSVDLYLSGVETPTASRTGYDSDALARQEWDREKDDIRFLYSLPDRLNDNAISSLETRARKQAPLLPLIR